jgi:hypothetical protein
MRRSRDSPSAPGCPGAYDDCRWFDRAGLRGTELHPIHDHTQSDSIVKQSRYKPDVPLAKKIPRRERVTLGQVNLERYFIVLTNGFHTSDRIPRVHNRHPPADAFCPNRERSGSVGPKLQPGWQIHFEEQTFVSIPMFVDPSLWDTSQLVNTPFG